MQKYFLFETKMSHIYNIYTHYFKYYFTELENKKLTSNNNIFKYYFTELENKKVKSNNNILYKIRKKKQLKISILQKYILFIKNLYMNFLV